MCTQLLTREKSSRVQQLLLLLIVTSDKSVTF